MDVFIFRCEDCGFEAPEYDFDKGPAAPGMGRGSVIGFPKPICPDCGSHDVDMNHADRPADSEQEEDQVMAWRKVK